MTDVFENSAPAFSEANATFTSNENLASAFSVTATDPDANATLLYSKSGPDAGLFTLNVATGEIAFVNPPDFENPTDANQNGVYELTITVSDGTVSAFQSVLIEVGDVFENATPVDIGLSHASVAENQPVETIVGDFNATDPDANAIHVFTLVDGNGSAHNASFAIDANGTLRTATVFDFEANGTSLAIRVKATDEHNASLEKTFTITITDDPSDNPVVPDTNATSPDTNATSPDTNATSPDTNATSPDTNATSPDTNATSPDTNATSPDTNATSPDTNATSPDTNATSRTRTPLA